MEILKFKQFSVLESKLEVESPLIKHNEILDIKFTDNSGVCYSTCKMVEHGWALNRTIIYYRFMVLESDSDKYPVGAELILPLDFNDKVDTFLIYPYYNEEHSVRQTYQKIYKSHCEII
jgi:hypothetical protein